VSGRELARTRATARIQVAFAHYALSVAPGGTRSRKGWLLAVPLVLALALVLWVALRPPVGLEALSRTPPTSRAQAVQAKVELAEVDQRESVPVEEPAPPQGPEVAPTPASPEPEIVSYEESGPIPPDPIQQGSAILDLQLLDAATEQPFASYVELWRIDAPENEGWTSGDQLQDQAQVPSEGWAFMRLPEGRYRVVCNAQAWNEAAPEVDVRAPRTQFSPAIALPREFHVRLDVRDRYGVQVPSLSLGKRDYEVLDAQDPWRGERTLKSQANTAVGFSASRMGSKRWSGGVQPADGFDLGVFREADRGGHRRELREYVTPGGGHVRVRIPPRRDSDLDLVVVALTKAEVEPLVRVPPGWAGQLDVSIVGDSVQRDGSLRGAGWDRAPVSMCIGGAGLLTFLHAWRAADGELL